MDRLLQIGFRSIGRWELQDGELRLRLDTLPAHQSALYAFAAGTTVLYVGKTAGALPKRLAGYLSPHSTQRTNVRNHASLLQMLGAGSPVDIYGWIDPGLQRVGAFQLSMAAGLEDDIIRVLAPPWNGGRSPVAGPATLPGPGPAALVLESHAVAAPAPPTAPQQVRATVDQPLVATSGPVARFPPESPAVMPGLNAQPLPKVQAARAVFTIRLGTTYYSQGFFNVPVAFSHHFAAHGAQMELYCGSERALLTAVLDRKANQTNKTPRIYGKAELGRWIQQAKQLGDLLEVTVIGPNEILLN